MQKPITRLQTENWYNHLNQNELDVGAGCIFMVEFFSIEIGIDKESKSISFFCCSLYTDERGFFTQKEFVCLWVCVCVQYNLCL